MIFFGVGMILASVQYSAIKHPVHATTADNVMGWIWADSIGWTSLNDQNPSACTPGPCGSYGVNIDTVTRNMNGFAWNDGTGWICFGNSCSVSACVGTPPAGVLEAHMNPISGITPLYGWGKVCSKGDAGWISLNCADYPGACGAYNYRVQYNPATKKFTPNVPPPYDSLAWNGNLSGTGFGYIDFSHAYLNSAPENSTTYGPSSCKDGTDNDLNGLADCQDPACTGTVVCQQIPQTSAGSLPVSTDAWGNDTCFNGINDNGTGVDCASPACKTDYHCVEAPGNTTFNGTTGYTNIPPVTQLCGNGIDDNGNGTVDCADPGCAGFAGPPVACAPLPPPAGSEPSCTATTAPFAPLGSYACCHNAIDDDGNGLVDCADPTCQAVEPTCVPAWLQTNFGNVYAQEGIAASSSPLLAGQFNTRYCVTAHGSITGFTSESGCIESGSRGQTITLPKSSGSYQGTLGKIDIAGIKSGRHGQVVELPAGPIALPSLLGGKVYYIQGNATLSATILDNGTLQTDHGDGLLFVEGNLTITGDITYSGSGSLKFLRNLASFGVIVIKNSVGAGGNIIIKSNVQKIVGAYYAENIIQDQTACPGQIVCATEVPLDVYGLMAAHQFKLDRNYRSTTRGAEVISFDGRAVSNPPPGMVDIAKSLPITNSAF